MAGRRRPVPRRPDGQAGSPQGGEGDRLEAGLDEHARDAPARRVDDPARRRDGLLRRRAGQQSAEDLQEDRGLAGAAPGGPDGGGGPPPPAPERGGGGGRGAAPGPPRPGGG